MRFRLSKTIFNLELFKKLRRFYGPFFYSLSLDHQSQPRDHISMQGANRSAIFFVRFYTVRDLSGNTYEVGNMIYPVCLHMLNQKCRTLQKNLQKMQCRDSTIYCIVLLRDLPTLSSVISM